MKKKTQVCLVFCIVFSGWIVSYLLALFLDEVKPTDTIIWYNYPKHIVDLQSLENKYVYHLPVYIYEDELYYKGSPIRIGPFEEHKYVLLKDKNEHVKSITVFVSEYDIVNSNKRYIQTRRISVLKHEYIQALKQYGLINADS